MLSIVLPVRNAQDTLREVTGELLELVSELTDRFELVIVDDASTDLTEEVGHALARRYPQLRMMRTAEPVGSQAAAQAGIGASRGDVIFIKDEATTLRASDLREMWAMREDDELVMASRPAAPPAATGMKTLDPELVSRLMQWGAAVGGVTQDQEGALRMLRRRGVEQLQQEEAAATTPHTAMRPDGAPAGATRAAAATASAGARPAATPIAGAGATTPAYVSESEQIRRRMPPRPPAIVR